VLIISVGLALAVAALSTGIEKESST